MPVIKNFRSDYLVSVAAAALIATISAAFRTMTGCVASPFIRLAMSPVFLAMVMKALGMPYADADHEPWNSSLSDCSIIPE
ncbi:MAG: hypothetical protein M0T84_02685 [Betaproteobacteria bacterium]|nr:hypothetical protein [Betaproteobacteria bacterium]